MHLYRWDLDKTYLATDIHSVRGLVRAATEPAQRKQNVPGAPELFRGLLAHDPSARAEIISGSPTQMRAVLEQKLALDGIRYDALVLKDNLGNLRRGRLRGIRGQLGYKLPQLLRLRTTHPVDATEVLFGDDAEVDALIYALYAACLAGTIDATALARVMRHGDAYDDQIAEAVAHAATLRDLPSVDDIFIHVDRRLPLAEFARLAAPVRVVFSWFQAAFRLYEVGRLPAAAAAAVLGRCVAASGYTDLEVGALTQDAVRRRMVQADAVLDLLEEVRAPQRPAVEQALRLGGRPPPAPARVPPDWLGFFHAASTKR